MGVLHNVKFSLILHANSYHLACHIADSLKIFNFIINTRLNNCMGQITVSLLSSDPSIVKFYNSDKFKFNILHNRSDSLNITSFYKNDQGDIVIDIDYNETI